MRLLIVLSMMSQYCHLVLLHLCEAYLQSPTLEGIKCHLHHACAVLYSVDTCHVISG